MQEAALAGFRQLGSPTAGHPDRAAHPAIEATTGQLGQGFGMAVGMALAERLMAARFGKSLVDHRTWVLATLGDFMEGRQPRGSQLGRASSARETPGLARGRHRHRRVQQRPSRAGRRLAPVRSPRLGDAQRGRARSGSGRLGAFACRSLPQAHSARVPHGAGPRLAIRSRRRRRAGGVATGRPARHGRTAGLVEAPGASPLARGVRAGDCRAPARHLG